MKAYNTLDEVHHLTRIMKMHHYAETGQTRTLNPTHIVQDLDTLLDGHINSLCGIHTPNHNYLTINEMLGRPTVHPQEVFLEEDERQKYIESACPDCLDHPDYALLLLANC